MKLFILIAFVVCISLFTFYPTFNLALFGDDWLAFFRYLQHLGPKSSGEWNYITYFLTPYGAQDILMGQLQKIFGYQPAPYFVISYILRVIAAFSLYPLVFYLTKSKLATIYAVLFFAITTTGLDTTNWVFNMPSYITIALFNLCLYFFLKSWKENGISLLITAGFLYYFAYVITPIRMHGSLPLIVLLEAFLLFQARNLKLLKKSVTRISFFLLIFAVIRYTGHSQGPPQEAAERLTIGINTMILLLQNGDLSFLFNPAVMFGSMFIPDFILPLANRNILLLSIGITVSIVVTLLMMKTLKKKNISTALFLGLSWLILSFFFAWWWVPTTIFPTTYRYLIPSAVGVSILIATIIALGKNKAQQRLLFTVLSLLIILHIISTRVYINYLIRTHNQDISKKIWAAIPYIPEIGKSSEPVVFYFEGDGTNETILHDVITFGFPPHMGLIYNLREQSLGFPVATQNWQEVISAVESGKILLYAFYLSGQDNLIDISRLAREKLKQL